MRVNVTDLDTIINPWIDDLMDDDREYNVGCALLTMTPDVLYLGRRTHIVAVKNRKAGAMVVPDFTDLCFGIAIESLPSLLYHARNYRTQWVQKTDGSGWEEREVGTLIWRVAPVDQFFPDVFNCDLDTLRCFSIPVLNRETETLLRKFARRTSEEILDDTDWPDLLKDYEQLGTNMPNTYLIKRLTILAKARLTNKQ